MDIDEDGTIVVQVTGPDGTAAEPRIYSDGAVTELPRYRKGTEYQMASFSDDGLIAAGHMTGVGTIQNQPLVWKCRAKQ